MKDMKLSVVKIILQKQNEEKTSVSRQKWMHLKAIELV